MFPSPKRYLNSSFFVMFLLLFNILSSSFIFSYANNVSNAAFLVFFSYFTRSSTESFVTNVTTLTSLSCPKRCTLLIACYSIKGFHHGSIIKTKLATCKLRPKEPTLRVMIRTCIYLTSSNILILSPFVFELSEPVITIFFIFSRLIVCTSNSTTPKKEV